MAKTIDQLKEELAQAEGEMSAAAFAHSTARDKVDRLRAELTTLICEQIEELPLEVQSKVRRILHNNRIPD